MRRPPCPFALAPFALAVLALLLLAPRLARGLETRTFAGGTYSISRPVRAPADGLRLLVFLHGQGGSSRQAVDLWGEDGPANGYVVVGPASAGETWVSHGRDAAFVYGLVAHLQRAFDVPPARTLAVGYSAGGAAAYFFFLPRPQLVGAFCSVDGFIALPVLPALVAQDKVPILTLTGELDWNRRSVDAGAAWLRRAGYTVHAGTLTGARHEYDPRRLNPIILKWFEALVGAAGEPAAR